MGTLAQSRVANVAGQARWRLASRLLVMAVGIALLLGAMAYTLGHGSVDIPTDQVIQALRDRDSVKKVTAVIVHEQRLPRALVGALVGMNLAVAGVMLQGAVRSPLADPYILGISAGGGTAAAVVTLRLVDLPLTTAPLLAFVGSLIGALVVFAVAWDGSGVTTTRLVLAGVAITAMFGALTTTALVMSLDTGAQVISLFQWLVGGLYGADWQEYRLILPYSLSGLALALLLAQRANVLALGDDVAQGLGLRVEQTRFLMSAVAAVMAGSSVAVAGLIGFVGLLVPFVARKLVGSDFRFLIPTSGILGAGLLVWADNMARVIFPQWIGQGSVEFPVGIITAIIGGPLFLWLIRARRAQW